MPTMLALLAALGPAACARSPDQERSGPKHATRCDLGQAFETAEPVTIASGSLDCVPQSLSQDELRMDLLCHPRASPQPRSGAPLYVSRRASVGEPWGALERIDGPFPSRVDHARVSDDGRTVLYGAVRDEIVDYGTAKYPPGSHAVATVWIATRSDPLGPFDAARQLSEISPADSHLSYDVVAILSDASVFYYSVSFSTEATTPVYRARRLADASWVSEIPPPRVHMENRLILGAITSDELHAFFTAYGDRFDQWHVAFASRASASEDFSPASTTTDVAAVNTDFYDTPLWVSDDGCVLYTRTVKHGGDANVAPPSYLLRAQRPPPSR
jgi:hypothetical protein